VTRVKSHILDLSSANFFDELASHRVENSVADVCEYLLGLFPSFDDAAEGNLFDEHLDWRGTMRQSVGGKCVLGRMMSLKK
jgi:hypothetical protein